MNFTIIFLKVCIAAALFSVFGFMLGVVAAGAVQRDRDNEARRKREERAAKRAVLGNVPPPLPAVPLARPTVPVANDPAALLEPAQRALDVWRGTDLEPILLELVSGLEEWRKYSRERKLVLAKVVNSEVQKLLDDSSWSDRIKKIRCESGGRILSKLMNKSGVSVENKDEVIYASAAIALCVGELRFDSRMNKIIAASKAANV